jgi:hypothetical protein
MGRLGDFLHGDAYWQVPDDTYAPHGEAPASILDDPVSVYCAWGAMLDEARRRKELTPAQRAEEDAAAADSFANFSRRVGERILERRIERQ